MLAWIAPNSQRIPEMIAPVSVVMSSAVVSVVKHVRARLPHKVT